MSMHFEFAGDHFASGGDDEQVFVWRTCGDGPAKRAAEKACPPEAASKLAKRHNIGKQQPARSCFAQHYKASPARPALVAVSNSKCQLKAAVLADPACNPKSSDALTLSKSADPLAATLQHLVSQLDLITATMAIVEERLSVTEDRLRTIAAATPG